MIPDEIKVNLTAEQWEIYAYNERYLARDDTVDNEDYENVQAENKILEALAERNRLLGTMNLESICDVLGCLIYDENANAFPEKHFNQADMVELEDIYEKLDDLRDTIAAALKGVGE